MAEQASITVGDVAYELPALDTISIGESKIIKRHSGMTLDQLFELEGLDGGAIGGLLAVAMKRHDQSLTDRELDRLVDEVNMFSIMEELAARADETPNPTKESLLLPAEDSKPSKSESTASSGANGSDDSEHSLEKSTPVSTGVPASQISTDSDPTTSAR